LALAKFFFFSKACIARSSLSRSGSLLHAPWDDTVRSHMSPWSKH
jgi:hypothetical protein